MPGLFDGMRISTSGINAFRVLSEIAGQNIANASNKSYTKQEAHLNTLGSIWDGNVFFGQGVEVSEVVRVRDEILDTRIRESNSDSTRFNTLQDWYQRLQATYNEPSDSGINAALSKFWKGWSDLSQIPNNQAARAEIRTTAENLAFLLKGAHSKLNRMGEEIQTSLTQTVDEINALTTAIAQLNADIFQIEAGRNQQANDLRDQRDAALDDLSRLVEISYVEAENGMVNVSIAEHPAVLYDRAEDLTTQTDPLDASKIDLVWEFGARTKSIKSGQISAILDVRDTIIPAYKSDVNTIANVIINEVNKIYANGVATNSNVLMESRLGYQALGVNAATDTLSLLNTGEYGTLYVTFHDANKNVVRSHGVIVDDNDSLQDIANKLNNVRGLNASLLSGTTNDGRLSLEFDTLGTNVLGETGFTISNNKEAHDTSGVLDRLGFNTKAKSTNTSAVVPMLTSADLLTLQTPFGVTGIANVMNHQLNMSGTFTINAFETMTESVGKTDGNLVQQLAINVTSTDTINTIMAKINALTADYGVAIVLNGGTNQLELTSTAQTDANGEVVLAAGVDYLRLGFANEYRSPAVPGDSPPANYTGLGDNMNLYSTLQFNTLFQGADASDIALDDRILSPTLINAGYQLKEGSNDLSIALAELQHQRVGTAQQFTIGEQFANLIAGIGTDVKQAEELALNEEKVLEGFISQKDRISGVSLDEELANMIQFQRSYEANARMFRTFDEMAEEILRLT